jgi:uncharacterized membrane protein HdeD (DUF308 family)
MVIEKIDVVAFRAFSNLATVALLSMGLLSFWLSNHRTSANIVLFLSMMFISLLIRFCAIYIISKNVGRVKLGTVLPIFWFVIFCYLIQSDNLDDQYINFWLGLFFILIGFVRIAQSFDTIVAPFRYLIAGLAILDFLVGICLLASWPSSILWNAWVVVGIDLISTAITLYLFTTNILKMAEFSPKVEA